MGEKGQEGVGVRAVEEAEDDQEEAGRQAGSHHAEMGRAVMYPAMHGGPG